MSKIKSNTRFCDRYGQPERLLGAEIRFALSRQNLEYRLSAKLVCTIHNSIALRSRHTFPQPGGKGGNPTNLFHEEKNLKLPSSCHRGISFRKPELRKQNMLIGKCENLPLGSLGIRFY